MTRTQLVQGNFVCTLWVAVLTGCPCSFWFCICWALLSDELLSLWLQGCSSTSLIPAWLSSNSPSCGKDSSLFPSLWSRELLVKTLSKSFCYILLLEMCLKVTKLRTEGILRSSVSSQTQWDFIVHLLDRKSQFGKRGDGKWEQCSLSVGCWILHCCMRFFCYKRCAQTHQGFSKLSDWPFVCSPFRGCPLYFL